MLLYILLTVITVMIGLFVRENCIAGIAGKTTKQQALNRVCIWAVILLLFAVSACRIAIGNDYWPYRFNFLLIAQSRVVSSEFGFNIIVLFMQWVFGYDNYIPIFALFSFITVYYFIKALYDQSEWFAFSLFLFLTSGYYFSSFNSVRYFMALAIAFFGMKYVLKGKPIAFVICIILAAFFHKSVLIVIPGYYLAKMVWKKWFLIPGAAICASLLIFRDFWRRLIFIFYPFYENSDLDTYDISYVNIAKAAAILVFTLIYYKKAIKGNTKNTFYFQLNILSLIVYSCCWFMPEASRIGFYFSASNVLLIPSVIRSIENKRMKIFWGLSIAAAYTVYFAEFLKRAYDINIRLLPYLEWIFH